MPEWIHYAELVSEVGCLVLLGFIAIRLLRITRKPAPGEAHR